MTYAEKLRHPLWQRKRLEIFQRDNWACVTCCDMKTNLQVHHKIYKKGRDPWDYKNGDLETLCDHCHFLKTYWDKEPFLVIKTGWAQKGGLIILAYCAEKEKVITRILRLVFKPKSIKELSSLPVNLNPLKIA